MIKNSESLLCPSYFCGEESKLLGIKQEDGTVVILPKPLAIADDFTKICLDKGYKPEERFRFVGKCAESRCSQWKNKKCLVAQKAVSLEEKQVNTFLPICSIRPSCRWYNQEKAKACKFCKYINTKIPTADLLSYIKD